MEEIDENTEFDKPIKINGYTANNMTELQELYECDVITLDKYDKLVERLRNGEIGIIKKRKKYKELYEESERMCYRFRRDYYKIMQLIDKISEINENEDIAKLIAEIRK
jgi:hypothetical protein